MLKKIVSLCALAILLNSCSSLNNTNHHDYDTPHSEPIPGLELAMPKIDWSPNQKSSSAVLDNKRLRQELALANRESFNKIETNIPATIKILGGQEKSSIAINASSDFADNVEVKVSHETLTIEAINPQDISNLNSSKDQNIVYINVRVLNHLRSLGNENIIGQNISGGQVVIAKMGSGNLIMDGYINLRGLTLGPYVNVLIKGISSENLDLIDHDHDTVDLTGDIHMHRISKDSTGKLEITGIDSDDLRVTNKGDGSIVAKNHGGARLESLINNNSQFSMDGLSGGCLTIDATGPGKIILSGRVKNLVKKISNDPQMDLTDLRVENKNFNGPCPATHPASPPSAKKSVKTRHVAPHSHTTHPKKPLKKKEQAHEHHTKHQSVS